MQEFQIVLRSFTEVREFISLATVQPFRVTVGLGGHEVNAKSFIGMLCLDYSQPLSVKSDCADADFQSFRQLAGRFLA